MRGEKGVVLSLFDFFSMKQEKDSLSREHVSSSLNLFDTDTNSCY